jgi:hypothetical protein
MCVFMFSLGLFINTDSLLGFGFSKHLCISQTSNNKKLILDGNYLES